MGPEQCEQCCYSCVCGSCGVAFCCKSTKKTRIKILWVCLVLSMAASCIILACVVYSPDYPTASPSDMRPITKNVNFLFCEEVVVISRGLPFDAYVVPSVALSRRTVTNFTQDTAIFIDPGSYNHLSMYLLNCSHIDLRHHSKIAVTFLLFKGVSQFRKWQQGGDGEYIRMGTILPGDASFKYTVTVDDEYFFVYNNSNQDQTWVEITFDISRSVFVLDHSPPICLQQQECDVLLSRPDDVAVISLRSGDLAEFNHATLTTKCAPRIWAYLVLHGLPVLMIGICLSVIIQKFCSNASDTPDERSPLLYSAGLSPDYQTVTAFPPKYEDIVRDDSPPPYAQVVRDFGSYGIQAESAIRQSYGIQEVPAFRQHINLPVGTSPLSGHARIHGEILSRVSGSPLQGRSVINPAVVAGLHRGLVSSQRHCAIYISGQEANDRIRNTV